MLKEQAGNMVDRYLEHRYCENAREVYETIHTSHLDQFTSSWVDTLLNGLNGILYRLDQLPETTFKEMIEGIDRLSEARNELRLARFLFDVEEINPVYRLIMRNRAVLRSEKILHKVLQVWPLAHPS